MFFFLNQLISFLFISLGFHQYGYHIFNIDAEEYSRQVESMRAE